MTCLACCSRSWTLLSATLSVPRRAGNSEQIPEHAAPSSVRGPKLSQRTRTLTAADTSTAGYLTEEFPPVGGEVVEISDSALPSLWRRHERVWAMCSGDCLGHIPIPGVGVPSDGVGRVTSPSGSNRLDLNVLRLDT